MATLYVPDSKRRKKDREELALNAPSGPENRVNIIAQLEDAEGNPAGPQLDLPHDADPKQLEEVLKVYEADAVAEWDNGDLDYLDEDVMWAIDRVHLRNRLPIFASDRAEPGRYNQGEIGERVP